MDSDLDRFVRLKHMLNAVIAKPSNALGGVELSQTYNRLRDEVASLLPSELKQEFERLMEPISDDPIRKNDIIRLQTVANQASTRLSALGGWIDGQIEIEKRRAAG